MVASRKERRAARRRLTPSKIYTLQVTGAALEALAACLILRRDGLLVAMHYELAEDGGTQLLPQMQVMDRTAGWRARLVYWLLRL